MTPGFEVALGAAPGFVLLIQMGTVPQAAALEAIRQLGENVIPRFRERPTRQPSRVGSEPM